MTSISQRRTRQAVFRKVGGGTPAVDRVAESLDEVPQDEDQDLSGNEGHAFHHPEHGGEEMALFEGDTSTLPYDARRAFALLLRGPSIDDRHSKLWPVLIDHESRLRQLLHAAFLELVIDRDQKVAFTRPVHAPELDVPQLLREVRLTFLDTALVLFLRMRLTLAEAAGERATLSRSEITDHLKAYEASDNVDASRFGRQIEAAIEKAKKYNFLRLIRNSGDRFEVSPALKLVFSHEQVSALLQTYRQIQSTTDSLPGGRALTGELDGHVSERSEADIDDEADGGEPV
ncbi:DUF4194 domain-containing protein [Cupriavidus taiwanensis]|uniref:DUF4194 domain-containing protein n=1 Tax=Cupriavidus taiwanensis TaxID=164546 RepID=A0A975WRI6_9BURK|nr:conserved hypothetical protein [Cupriavidus taiwanensis]